MNFRSRDQGDRLREAVLSDDGARIAILGRLCTRLAPLSDRAPRRGLAGATVPARHRAPARARRCVPSAPLRAPHRAG